MSADDTDVAAIDSAVRDGAGAVLLFGAGGPADLGTQLHALKAVAPEGAAPIVMTDEEGGEVQRVSTLVGDLPWARTDSLVLTPEALQAKVRAVGTRMAGLGITMDLAPVLDLSDGPGPDATHPDGQRSFSIKPPITTLYGLAFMHGLMAGGVIPVIKHFPGLGTANNNTDTGPALIAPLDQLEARDLLPFEAAIAAGAPAVMISSAVISGGPDQPAIMQRAIVTGLLRHHYGFRGLIVTDALVAGALHSGGYSANSAAVAALRAGADLVLGGNLGAAADNASFQGTTASIVAAVDAHRLSLARLRAAASLVHAAQSGLSCLRAVVRR